MSIAKKDAHAILDAATAKLRGLFLVAIVFSFAINLLILTAPLYMLQIYDRVLSSRSGETLLFLTIAAIFALLMLGALDAIRARLMTRIAAKFDHQLSERAFACDLRGGGGRQIRDLDAIRGFIGSPAAIALMDAPWAPVFIAFIYLMHPALGHLALGGALSLFALALVNDRATATEESRSMERAASAHRFAQAAARNREAIAAMGMLRPLSRVWRSWRDAAIGFQARAADRRAAIAGFAKFLRLALQVAMLGLGAYLAIGQVVTPGVMIAASIIMGRALAPVEQSIQGWRAFAQARGAYGRLRAALEEGRDAAPSTPLPAPKGRVAFETVFARPPGAERHVLRNVSFEIAPGEALGVTGPSGAGKSTLARLLAGLWTPTAGAVRLDGGDLRNWDREALSAHFGYLPQDIELFDGTVAQNIARFQEHDPARAVEAAIFAGAHEFILSLGGGYDTRVGPSGENLSGGQRQRIALARAVYGKPSLVILDEPSSNLDPDGEAGLRAALEGLRGIRATIVLISHQPSLFLSMDKLLVLKDGQIAEFGPRAEVMQKIARRVVRAPNVVVR